MPRIRRIDWIIALALSAAAGSALFWHPAPASAQWEWLNRCFKKQDIDVLHPLIQQLLKQGKVGTKVAWCSTSGRQGNVYLVEGGDRAKATTATVRITIAQGRSERDWFVFRYRKDAARGWGIVG